MYILKCHTNGGEYSPEGNFVEVPVKEYKCRFRWSFAVKLVYAKIFYNWIEIKEC